MNGGFGALVKRCGKGIDAEFSPPIFRKDQRIQQYPVIRDRMLGKAAVFAHQFFNSVFKPFPALPGKMVTPFTPELKRIGFCAPMPPYKQCRRLAGSMIVVLRDGVEDVGADPFEVLIDKVF